MKLNSYFLSCVLFLTFQANAMEKLNTPKLNSGNHSDNASNLKPTSADYQGNLFSDALETFADERRRKEKSPEISGKFVAQIACRKLSRID